MSLFEKVFTSKRPTTSECQKAMDEIGKRELSIKAEQAKLSEEMDKLELRDDFEALVTCGTKRDALMAELELIPSRIEKLQRLLDQAEFAEAPAKVSKLVHALPVKLELAEKARAEHLAAQSELHTFIHELRSQKATARIGRQKSKAVSEKTFLRLVEVFDILGDRQKLKPSLIDSRVEVSRAAKLRTDLTDSPLDASMVAIWKSLGFTLYPEESGAG